MYANITENTVDNCTVGIRLYFEAHRNTIYKNCIANNSDYGFWFQWSIDNTIYYNTITNNGIQANDVGAIVNDWHHPVLLEGNYWSDYCGYDDGSGTGKHAIAGDGIGDTDIAHPTTYYDFYPLMYIPYLCIYKCPTCNTAPVAHIGESYIAFEGSTVIFNASNSSDADGDILQYRWDFNSDGIWDTNYSTDPNASYSWDDDYSGNVTVEVSDGSLIDTATTMVIVNNVAPVAVAGLDQSGDEPSTFVFTGSHSDPGVLDTHIYEWDFDGDGIFETSGNNIPYTWEDDFSGVITLKVTDDDGDWSIDTCSVTVYNVAPVITSLTGPIDPVQIYTPITITGIFEDPGTLDTHYYKIDWGDNNTTETPGYIDITDNTITEQHTYAEAGVYTVTVYVEDDDYGNDTETYSNYIVIYDPNGGFVTGGGWINSPTGAYKVDPNLTGKANFGFVSKYVKNQNTPIGNTEFNFKAGNLNFHSNNYEWLVVTGAKAMFKGEGTINGDGNFKFMLSAIDEKLTQSADTDLFRIRIWEEDDLGNETVIYDNHSSDDIDEDPETEISSGNIVIHKT
jgi:parallel beta-helix repeat protein